MEKFLNIRARIIIAAKVADVRVPRLYDAYLISAVLIEQGNQLIQLFPILNENGNFWMNTAFLRFQNSDAHLCQRKENLAPVLHTVSVPQYCSHICSPSPILNASNSRDIREYISAYGLITPFCRNNTCMLAFDTQHCPPRCPRTDPTRSGHKRKYIRNERHF